MQRITVYCGACEHTFHADVGWTRFNWRVLLRALGRGGSPTFRLKAGVTPHGAVPHLAVADLELRVPLRARRCGDHAAGTQHCEGRLERHDRKEASQRRRYGPQPGGAATSVRADLA